MEKVVIVGAGPAGLVAAAYFARRGMAVEVFEKRGPVDPNKEVNHSFTIVLNYKGIKSIQCAGLDLPQLFSFPLLACVRHLKSYHNAFLRPAPGTAANFERSELTLWLMESVTKLHPSVKIHYNAACIGIDFDRREATFRTSNGRINAKYDLLVGADGCNSTVRELMTINLPDFSFSCTEAPLIYKRFRRLACPVNLSEGYGHGSVVHFHAVRLRPDQGPKAAATAGGPRGGRGLMRGFLALVNHEDGTVSGGLSVYKGAEEMLTHLEDYQALLSDLNIPVTSTFRQQLASTLATKPWTWGGAWVSCSRLDGPRVVLVGDAAHAVSPSLGQGCNAALEDVQLLDQVVGEAGGCLQEVPARFSALRLADGNALVWLDRNARAMRGQQGWYHPCLFMYFAHMYLRPALKRVFLGVGPPSMSRLWSQPMSYTLVKRDMITDGALLGLALLLLLLLLVGVAVCPELFGRAQVLVAAFQRTAFLAGVSNS